MCQNKIEHFPNKNALAESLSPPKAVQYKSRFMAVRGSIEGVSKRWFLFISVVALLGGLFYRGVLSGISENPSQEPPLTSPPIAAQTGYLDKAAPTDTPTKEPGISTSQPNKPPVPPSDAPPTIVSIGKPLPSIPTAKAARGKINATASPVDSGKPNQRAIPIDSFGGNGKHDLHGHQLGWFKDGRTPEDYDFGIFTDPDGINEAYIQAKTAHSRPFASLTNIFDFSSFSGSDLQVDLDISTADTELVGVSIYARADDDNRNMLNFNKTIVRPTNGWGHAAVKLSVPQETGRLFFGIILDGKGSVFVKNASVRPID